MHGVAAEATGPVGEALPSREDRAVSRRRRLIEAARQLFAERGFHGAGMAQLATLSGVKVGQIYRDFASKEDLVAAIVEADLATFLDEPSLRAALMAGDGLAARNWIADLVLRKTSPDHAPLVPEILAEAARNPRIAEILTEADHRIRGCLLSALALFGSDPGHAERAAAAADLILTVMTGLCTRQLALASADQTVVLQRIHSLIDGELAALRRGDRTPPLEPGA